MKEDGFPTASRFVNFRGDAVAATASALITWAAGARLLAVWLSTGPVVTALIGMVCALFVAMVCLLSRRKIRENPWHMAYLASLHLLVVQVVAHALPAMFLLIKEPRFYEGIAGAVVLFALALYRTRVALMRSAGLDIAIVCLASVNAYLVFAARLGWL